MSDPAVPDAAPVAAGPSRWAGPSRGCPPCSGSCWASSCCGPALRRPATWRRACAPSARSSCSPSGSPSRSATASRLSRSRRGAADRRPGHQVRRGRGGLLMSPSSSASPRPGRAGCLDCGCFGGGGPTEPDLTQYPLEIARDLALAALAAVLVRWPRSRFSLDQTLGLHARPPDRKDPPMPSNQSARPIAASRPRPLRRTRCGRSRPGPPPGSAPSPSSRSWSASSWWSPS